MRGEERIEVNGIWAGARVRKEGRKEKWLSRMIRNDRKVKLCFVFLLCCMLSCSWGVVNGIPSVHGVCGIDSFEALGVFEIGIVSSNERSTKLMKSVLCSRECV